MNKKKKVKLLKLVVHFFSKTITKKLCQIFLKRVDYTGANAALPLDYDPDVCPTI